MDRVTKPNNLHGLRSRSSSANSGSGCTSPARSPRPRSPSPPGNRDHLSTWSASVPALNAERHFENGHCNPSDQRRAGAGLGLGSKVERTLGKENDRPERPEKPERRPNSKELIEKQRNWTSHFSKTRPSRYNSDPNRLLVQTSLNSQNASQNVNAQQQPLSVDPSCQSNATVSAANDTASPATRSASFCSARSPPPPPPPVRNSSAAGRKERPASIAALNPSELLESPEYATIERFDDVSPPIPEYAVVQKPKKPQEDSKNGQDCGSIQDSGLPEYAIVQKSSSKSASRLSANSKEASKAATQNFKSSAPAEEAPTCKAAISSPKETSKAVVQNFKSSVAVEGAPGCKNAILRSVDDSKDTSKSSMAMEEATGFKMAVSKPTEAPKEFVDDAKEVSRSPVIAEEVADSRNAVANEHSDLPGQAAKTSLVLRCELSSPTRSSVSDSVQVMTKESDLLAPEYPNCPPSPIHSPAKTSEWRNEWLAKNDEILKRTIDLKELKAPSREAAETDVVRGETTARLDTRPDWAKPSANAKRKEPATMDDKRVEVRSPESELGLPFFAAGTDSASSSMSSPSSPSKDSKEEKAEKEMSEKHQICEYAKLPVRIILSCPNIEYFS